MKNCVAVFGLALVVALLTVPIADGGQGDRAQAFLPLSRVFEGCRPTPAACTATCSTRRISWDQYSRECPRSLSCYCLYGAAR